MVEILGVLAIIGVLSIGSIQGFNMLWKNIMQIRLQMKLALYSKI